MPSGRCKALAITDSLPLAHHSPKDALVIYLAASHCAADWRILLQPRQDAQRRARARFGQVVCCRKPRVSEDAFGGTRRALAMRLRTTSNLKTEDTKLRLRRETVRRPSLARFRAPFCLGERISVSQSSFRPVYE